MAPSEMTRIERQSVEYKPTYQRFVLKQKNYKQQYSHIYVNRLQLLRDAVLRRVEADPSATGGDVAVLPKIIDLRAGRECIIVGTTLKQLVHKPDLFEALTKDERIQSLSSTPSPLASAEDLLLLEDESGRVELQGGIDIAHLVTGVVLGVRGCMNEEETAFCVSAVFTPELAPQPALPERTESAYVALVSGVAIGRDADATPLRNHVLMDYLAGRLGDADEKAFVAQIVRTVFVGNSVDTASAVGATRSVGMQKKKSAEQLAVEAAPMRNLDELVSTLASAMSVDVMPGASDPSNHAMPQQSFHACLFPRSARFASFRAVTNPYAAEIGGVSFLGHSGQPLQSVLQCTAPSVGHGDVTTKMTEPDAGTDANGDGDVEMNPEAGDGSANGGTEAEEEEEEEALSAMARCLSWRHVAPTAPDLLASFPMANDDPFVMEACPHVFFAGNAKRFGSRMVEGANGQRVQVVLVPSFADTATIVLVDLKDLSCFPISIAL